MHHQMLGEELVRSMAAMGSWRASVVVDLSMAHEVCRGRTRQHASSRAVRPEGPFVSEHHFRSPQVLAKEGCLLRRGDLIDRVFEPLERQVKFTQHEPGPFNLLFRLVSLPGNMGCCRDVLFHSVDVITDLCARDTSRGRDFMPEL